MKNLLAIDFGLRWVGLAFGDWEKNYIYGYKTIAVSSLNKLIKEIKKIVEEKNIDQIIIGDPKSLEGKETERARLVKRFKEKLEKLVSCRIVLFDERFTTDLAKRIIFPEDFKRTKIKRKESIKKDINLLSAILLLESYFKYEKGKEN
uniref:Putative pre-16S rRNA nuclease n=1 Tax=candidate division WOR-3 bacterium TaxID=2052148 RepID=A0A7V3ZUI4_UNCW3